MRGMFMTEEQFKKLLEQERKRLHDLCNQPSILPEQILQQSEYLDQLIVAFLQKKLSILIKEDNQKN